jgi:hypothetical protein
MKKIAALNWSYVAVIALAVALYLGFDELIVPGQSETARETLNAAIGVIFVIITTMYMLTKQTEIEQEKELKNEILKQQLKLYEYALETWQKVCFVDSAIDKDQFGRCVQAHFHLGMLAPADVLDRSNKIFGQILAVYNDSELRPMNSEEQEKIFIELSKFIEATRTNLALPGSALSDELHEGFSENVVKAGTAINRNYDKFSFNNKVLGKGRLVLELVKYAASSDKVANIEDLRKIFPNNYWKKGREGKGKNEFIVEFADDAEKKKARFFNKDNEKILLKDGSLVVVNNQWGDDNFSYLLERLPTEIRAKIQRVVG